MLMPETRPLTDRRLIIIRSIFFPSIQIHEVGIGYILTKAYNEHVVQKGFYFTVSTRDAAGTCSTSPITRVQKEITVVKIKNKRKCRSKEWRQASAPGTKTTSKEARSLEGRKECDIYA